MAARIAVLVLAHDPEPLAHLLMLLDDRFAVFVHMDAKSPATALDLPGHATLIAERHAVFWGGWSMMQATRALLDAARRVGGFSRHVLVSGDCLPVLELDMLEAILLDQSKEFIELHHVADDPTLAGMDIVAATAKHGWEQPWRRYNPVFWDHLLLNPFQRSAAAAHYSLDQGTADWLRGDVERLMHEVLTPLVPPCPYPDFYYGSQWWALTDATLAAIDADLHSHDAQNFFRHIRVPDEHMLQTILGNRGTSGATAPMMYTDLARRPDRSHVLTAADLAKARAQNALFARKFDPATAPDIAASIAAGEYWRRLRATAEPCPDSSAPSDRSPS